MPIPTVQAVGRTYDKLNLIQRDYVWEQREKGVSGAQIARDLAVGVNHLDPPVPKVTITPQRINAAYRAMKLERDQIYFRRIASLPTDAIMERNRRELSAIAGAELDRLRAQQQRGKLDAVQLAKLAVAIEKIERMEMAAARRAAKPPVPAPDAPAVDRPDQDEKPGSFADSLLDEAAKREAELAAGQGIAVTDDQEPPVPDDPTGQDTTNGFGVSHATDDGSVSSSVASAPSA